MLNINEHRISVDIDISNTVNYEDLNNGKYL